MPQPPAKEEMRSTEWGSLVQELPPLMNHQLENINELLKEVVKEGNRESLGVHMLREYKRESSCIHLDLELLITLSDRLRYRPGIRLSEHGSLVSGLITDHSDFNYSLTAENEDCNFFTNGVFPEIVKATNWSEVRLCESPTGLVRIEAFFIMGQKVTIDWKNDDGVRLSEMLSFYNQLHDDVLPMRKIVRKWAEKCDLITREKLCSQHAVPPLQLDLMLIHSLQQTKRLPCLAVDRNNWDQAALSVDKTPWNLAQVFLEFLRFYSKGDAQQNFIKITSTDIEPKKGSKFSENHLTVMDPIRNRPIAPMKPHFQLYFLNCFLASYVNFRIPRLRGEKGSNALVLVKLFQAESQQPEEDQPDKEGEPVLESTFQVLSIKIKEYKLSEAWTIFKQINRLSKDEYAYSFNTFALTGGFCCDQPCVESAMPAVCPKPLVPPIEQLPLDRSMPHHIEELDRVIESVFISSRLTPARQRKLDILHHELTSVIGAKLKSHDFRLEVYGSSENGFGSITSDFDVSFRYEKDFDREERTPLETIAIIKEALTSNTRFNRVHAITTARIPIVKFEARVNEEVIEGDISCDNELALSNTRMLKLYCTWTKDDVLSKLGIFIKRWAKQCDIADAAKGSLSSYAYIILLIHFLQQLQPHPLLPVLQETGEKKENLVQGCDVYFNDGQPQMDWSQCILTVGELFLQFLDYYNQFDWQNKVVQISRTTNLTTIERYYKMCIKDPFDLSRNLASGIGDQMFDFIKKAFAISREVFFTIENSLNDQRMTEASLLEKCRISIGKAPQVIVCSECRGWGHYATDCWNRASTRGRGRGAYVSGRNLEAPYQWRRTGSDQFRREGGVFVRRGVQTGAGRGRSSFRESTMAPRGN